MLLRTKQTVKHGELSLVIMHLPLSLTLLPVAQAAAKRAGISQLQPATLLLTVSVTLRSTAMVTPQMVTGPHKILMAIFGNSVTINGLTLMPKAEPNKTIEVVGNNTTIENTTIEPNTLVDQSVFNNLSDPTESQWGGSMYYNNAGGTQMLDNVTVDNGGVSYHAAAAGVQLVFKNVKLNYSTNVDWINSYRYSNHFDNPAGSTLSGTPKVDYHVSSTMDNLSDVLANAKSGDTIDLDSNLTTSQQITLTNAVTLNGNGYTLSPSFAYTNNSNNSALGIQSSNVTVNNLVKDGTHGTNLHGINVYDASNVVLKDITAKNNNHTGLNVDGSKVTVDNLTTANNGWDGADVDKPGAVFDRKRYKQPERSNT